MQYKFTETIQHKLKLFKYFKKETKKHEKNPKSEILNLQIN